jgi:hypothetical protein
MSVITNEVNAIVAKVGIHNLQINNSNAVPQSVGIAFATAAPLGVAMTALQTFAGKSHADKLTEWTAANTGEAFDLWEARQILVRDEIAAAATERVRLLSEAVNDINALLADACTPVFVSGE